MIRVRVVQGRSIRNVMGCNYNITMKKIWLFSGLTVVFVVLGFIFIPHISDDDCDEAYQLVNEQVGEFTQLENEIGRCDGICRDWSLHRCVIADDVDSWFVTPWGTVKKQ